MTQRNECSPSHPKTSNPQDLLHHHHYHHHHHRIHQTTENITSRSAVLSSRALIVRTNRCRSSRISCSKLAEGWSSSPSVASPALNPELEAIVSASTPPALVPVSGKTLSHNRCVTRSSNCESMRCVRASSYVDFFFSCVNCVACERQGERENV